MNTDRRLFYVEDNPDDVMLAQLAMKKAGVTAQLQTAADADQAIALLESKGPEDLPDCILLDINLASSSGFEVLSWIRSNPHLKGQPVLMLTSSLLPGDINKAYELGANSYLVKPTDLVGLVELMKAVDAFWLRLNVRGLLLKGESALVTPAFAGFNS